MAEDLLAREVVDSFLRNEIDTKEMLVLLAGLLPEPASTPRAARARHALHRIRRWY